MTKSYLSAHKRTHEILRGHVLVNQPHRPSPVTRMHTEPHEERHPEYRRHVRAAVDIETPIDRVNGYLGVWGSRDLDLYVYGDGVNLGLTSSY